MALLPAAFAGPGLPTEHRMPSSEPLALPPHRTGTAEQNGGSARVQQDTTHLGIGMVTGARAA
jgi:hypothetical protein